MKFILGLIKRFFHSYTLPVPTFNIEKVLVVDLHHIGDMLMELHQNVGRNY